MAVPSATFVVSWECHHPRERAEVLGELRSQVPRLHLELLSSQVLLWVGKGPESQTPLWLKRWGLRLCHLLISRGCGRC